MKILSWNVNGIRACMKKGFNDWLAKENADIVCIQETKAMRGNLPADLGQLQGYHSYWHAGTRPGYAGTLTLSKQEPISWKNKFEVKEFSEHGRVIETEFPDFFLLNIYFPNGGTRADGTEMLSYKLRFYDDMIAYANRLRKDKSVIMTGDFNIAHTEKDIARPKENENSIGFTLPEREKFSELLENGYIDGWRKLNPDKIEYSWWSMRTNARLRNIGWRLDYFVLTPDLLDTIKKLYHQNSVMGSDHCPIVLELE
jgi:exodeoxyribonuclease-3